MAKNAKTEAEAKYARAQLKVREAKLAVSEAVQQAKRVEDNTARLKALRLARDAREAAELAANPPPPPVKKKKAPAKAKSMPVEELTAANDK